MTQSVTSHQPQNVPFRVYSPQQIKWDLLSAIREYGTDATQWTVCLSSQPPEETIIGLGHYPDAMSYMGKPAMTERAARLVYDFLRQRMGVATVETRRAGPWIIVFRQRPKGT